MFGNFQNHPSDKIALRDENVAIPYVDLEEEIEKKISELANVSVLGIALDNCVDWVLWDLATLKAGIPCVPVPPFFSPEQVSYLLHSAGVSHLISPEGLRDTGMGRNNILPPETAKVTFTSGTTGEPKGVCLSQSAMKNVASSIVEVLGEDFAGNHQSIMPLSVLLENVAGVYAALIAGCTINLTSLKKFGDRYENLHSILKNNNATSAILVPEILRALMAQTASKGALPDLKYCAVGGSKIDPSLLVHAHKIGLPVYEGYGLSECASVVSLNTPQSNKTGSAGKLLPHIKARINNNEIEIKNAGFLGYIGEEKPHLIKTGDIGEIDEEGFLDITGRKKNVLITSYGRNISPEWVESVLLAQPAIAQVIVYGDAQSHLSALVVLSSADASIKNAINTANKNLPDYAQIKNFQIVAPFTMENGTLTGTGRPRRKEILNLYTKENEHELLQSIG